MEKKSIEYVLPEEIEKRSFEIIAAELAERGITLPAEQDPVTRRVIHTSADFDYAETMTYSENAVEIAKNLIKNGADIVTDTNMALAGINKKVLASFGGEAHCYMADAPGIRYRGPCGFRECGSCQGADYGDGCALYHQSWKKRRQQRGSGHLQCLAV